MAMNDAELRQIPGGSWQNGQWYSDSSVPNPAKNIKKGGKSYHLAYITDEEARILDKDSKGSYFSAQEGKKGKTSGKEIQGNAPMEWVSEPSHAKSRLVYIDDKGASQLKKLDIHGSGVDKKDHFGPMDIPSYQGDGGGGTGGFGGGGNSGGFGFGGGDSGDGGGYGFGGMSVGPGQSGMSGFGGNLGGTGSFGGVSPGAAGAAAGAAGFGGFGGAGFGGNGWGGLAGTTSNLGLGDMGPTSYGLDGMFGYGLSADGNLGMMGGENAYGLSSYSPPAFSAQSSEPASLGESFVADPEREEHEKKKMLKSVIGPVAAAVVPGPLGSLAANSTATALGLQSQDQMGKNMFGNIAGMVGTTLGGPLGGVVGAALGRSVGPATGARGEAGNSGFLSNVDWGGVGAGLAGLYSANKAADAYKAAQQNSMGSVQQQLSDMFGPNSAYAQQLRQELERRDAASGRRSQYGPREVELQARLAEMSSRAAPGMIGAATNQQQAAFQAAQAKQAQKNAQLNNLIQLGRATGAFDAIGRGVSSAAQNLGDMFGGGNQWGSGSDFGNQDLGLNF